MINLLKLKKKNSGLVHNIYLQNGVIYKIPKKQFKEFHNINHFLIEKISLDMLRKKGLSSLRVLKILNESENQLKLPILIESLATGYQKKRQDLNKNEMTSILHFLRDVHTIKLPGYGPMNINKRGDYYFWIDFIQSSLNKNLRYLVNERVLQKNEAKIIYDLIVRNKNILTYNKSGSLIIVDVNPCNFFFQNETIRDVIDIDHPIIGDPLYEYAALKWYHRKIFNLFIEKNKLSLFEFKKIFLYELICGVSIISWMHSNKLSVKKQVNKINQLMQDIEKSLIHLSDVTLLVVKPECSDKLKQIILELKFRGFKIEEIFKLSDFHNVVQKMYSPDYPKRMLELFSHAYISGDFGDEFYVLIIKHMNGKSIASLSNEIGHYKNYQLSVNNSLRHKFGLPSTYNVNCGRWTIYFNGFHRIDDIGDFIKHLNIFNIRLIK